MIDEKEIEGLRHTEYNSDPLVMEMLDTIEALWKVAKVAEEYDICSNEACPTSSWDEEIPCLHAHNLHEALAALQEPGKGATGD